MQVATERGIIYVEGAYQSAERAQMDGYRYSFTAHNVYMPDLGTTLDKVDFYSTSDDEGLHHTFVYIQGY